MNKHFLTTKYFLKGKLLNIAEKFTFKKLNLYTEKSDKIGEYKLVRWVKRQNKYDLSSLGIFEADKKVIIKSVKFKLKNLVYEQLINEANMLELLSTFNKEKKVGFPKIYDFIETQNEALLISEFIDGIMLYEKSEDTKMDVLKTILNNFIILSSTIDHKTKKILPKRTSLQILLSFPIYLLNVTVRDIKNFNTYFEFLFIFFKNYFSLDIFKTNYVIAHKDLHSKNILIQNNTAFIIDPEVSVLADPETDIAHAARYYSAEVSDKKIIDLLKENLSTKKQRQNFIALTIYYSIQIMAIRPTDNSDYIEAKNYLWKYFNNLYDTLLPKVKKIHMAERYL